MSLGAVLWAWVIIVANLQISIEAAIKKEWYVLPNTAFFAGWMLWLLWSHRGSRNV